MLVSINCFAVMVEEVVKVPVSVTQKAYGLFGSDKTYTQDVVVSIARDDSVLETNPAEFVILNHGRSNKSTEIGTAKYGKVNRALAKKGFITATITRIGYGATGGPDIEYVGYSTCSGYDAKVSYEVAAETNRQVFEYMKTLPYTKKSGYIMGTSFGAVSTLFASVLPIEGLKAVAVFATTTMWQESNGKQNPCRVDVLQSYLKELAPMAKVPALWFFAENDSYSARKHQEQWFGVFSKSGAPKGTALTVYEPIEGEGHLLFAVKPQMWVEDFSRLTSEGSAQ